MNLTCDWSGCRRKAVKKVDIEVPEQITLYLCWIHLISFMITDWSKVKKIEDIPEFNTVYPVD